MNPFISGQLELLKCYEKRAQYCYEKASEGISKVKIDSGSADS